MQFHPTKIIQKKRENLPNTKDEIRWFVESFLNGTVADYQMSAWLMAINFNGMNLDETAFYTKTLIESGKQLDFGTNKKNIVDKHSTGGVGDKVSLILGPILASLNYKIPMLAGRSLEHTGGTIDKLESIPNFNLQMPLEQFQKNVNKIGLNIIMQSKEICPADGQIYALRDVTATVNSLPLICGSILSKKISEGIKTLVLDIKVGNGAFMKTINDAKTLGDLMVQIGQKFDLKVIPAYTGMDQPLGKTAGLYCEVLESIEFLKGNFAKDLYDVVFHLFQKFNPKENTKSKFDEIINSGKALEKFQQMVEIQGGNFTLIENNNLNKPRFKQDCFMNESGYLESINTREIGFAISQLGAGRENKKSKLDYSCGVEFHSKIGDNIDQTTPVFTIFGNDLEKLKIAKEKIQSAILISSSKTKIYYSIL